MIRYRADTTKWEVVAVECAQKGYPHEDAEGFTQNEECHFDTEADASAGLLAASEASVMRRSKFVEDVRARLVAAEKHLIEVTLTFAKIRANVSRKINQ